MGEWKVGQWIVGVISFQKIFGLCGLKGHIVDKRWGVTTVTHGNVKIVLESSKQDSQLVKSTPNVYLVIYLACPVPTALRRYLKTHSVKQKKLFQCKHREYASSHAKY